MTGILNNVRFTSDWVNNGQTILLHGGTGFGKTWTIRTCPKPFVVNMATENGLLTLKDSDIPYITVHNLDELKAVINELKSPNYYDKFETLCIDSLTELAEVCLAPLKKEYKDKRLAYVQMEDDVMEQIRNLITIPGKNLFCICKQNLVQDETGKMLFAPFVPGKSFSQKLPYYFDEVLALRVLLNESTGAMERFIQTQPDERYAAKDRSGTLNPFEEPNIATIISKIRGDYGNN